MLDWSGMLWCPCEDDSMTSSAVSSLMHANHYLSLVGVADLRAAVQDTVIDAIKGKHHPAHIS